MKIKLALAGLLVANLVGVLGAKDGSQVGILAGPNCAWGDPMMCFGGPGGTPIPPPNISDLDGLPPGYPYGKVASPSAECTQICASF